MLRHPLTTLDAVLLRWLFGLTTIASIVLMVVLRWIGEPLKTPPIYLPWGLNDGILALQFARDPATAQEIIDCWHGGLLFRVGFGIGIGFLFIATYVLAISCGCIWAASIFRMRFDRLSVIAELIAWAILLAGILDVIKNLALLRQLLAGAASPWSEVAFWCAAIKFILVSLGLIYLLVAATYVGAVQFKQLKG